MAEAPVTAPVAPATPAQPAASGKHRIPKRFKILTVLLLIATVLSALGTFHWIAELFSHFKPYYALACLLCVVALLLLQAWRWLALALVLALWNGYPVAQQWLQGNGPAAKTAKTTRQLTVFHFNVGRLHEQPSRVTSYLQRHAKAIDVVVLLEATTDFDSALDEIRELYPHQIRHLEDTPFGIALLSKHAFAVDMISFIPNERYPHIEAAIKLPDRAAPLAFYAVHAPPPLSADMAAARNAKLDYIARDTAAKAKSTPIVVGDFNLTPWSPYFQGFATASKLRDARPAHRFDHTWPVVFENAQLGIATDHSFAHPSLPLIKRVVGPDLGSDHLPVTVTFGY